MKKITNIVYIVYQYIIALPIFAVITLFTAIITMIFMHWRNAEWLHRIQQFWSRSFFYLLFIPVKIEGVENIDRHTSYVFVCNHQSMSDVFLIYGWLPVIFKWIMKKELRKIPFVGSACAAAGHIYIDRSNRMAAKRSMDAVEKQLTNGVCVVIFPEGTRTKTGEVGPFKRGAFSIATDLHLPIVPLSISGCFDLMPRQNYYAKWHPVTLTIGSPIMINEYNEENRNEIIEKVRAEVIAGIKK